MRIYKIITALLIILLFSNSKLNAQQNQSQISGYALNPEGNPALYSTVVLLNKDSVQIKGVLSGEDGSFVLDKITPGDYFVQIRSVEFQTYTTNLISITPNYKITLDTIQLATAINQLDEIVVKADKSLIEIHPDKMVYNVSASANASGSSGLELLEKAPGITIDMDNNIILQGKSGVQIYINGRPSRLSGTDLANMLQGMRSDNIESIEIITNPSSKYEAEGTAGIINIIMKKNPDTGLNGNLVTSYSQGIYSRGSIGSTLNYNSEKLAFNTNVTVTESDYQDNFVEVSEQRGYVLDMKTNGLYNRRGYNFSGGLDYYLNEKNSFTLDGRVFITKRNDISKNNTGIMDATSLIPVENLIAKNIEEVPSENYMLNLNYSYVPGSTSNFSTDFSYGKYTDWGDSYQPNTYYDANMDSVLRTINDQFDTYVFIDILSGKIDYEKKFDFLTFSTGAKYSYIKTDNTLDFYNIIEEKPVFDVTRSNKFDYEEKVAAFYFMLNAKPTEKLTLNAGIRMENTNSLGVLDSEISTLDDRVARSYNDFFPNFGISYNNQKNSEISASIGRRINRPNYQYLNPFESKMSELQSWKGNPFLQPNYVTNYVISYSYKQRLVISNTYSVTKDFFANIFVIVDNKASILTPRNMDKVINNGLSVTYPVKAFPWWKLSSFVNYNYETYEGDLQGTLIDLSIHTYSGRVQNMFKIPGDIDLEVTYSYYSPWIWRGSVRVKANQRLNVGIKKAFFNKMLLVQLTGNDILRTGSDYHYNSNYGGIITDGVRTFDNRRFGINLTYNFGNQQAKARQRSRSAIDDELNRISD